MKSNYKTTYRLKAPAFRMGRSLESVFLSRHRLFCFSMTGSYIFDTDTRKKSHRIKTCPRPLSVAVSDDGDWVATSNEGGEIIVSKLSDGSQISKYKKPSHRIARQLATCDASTFLDSSNGVVQIHSVDQEGICKTFNYGDSEWYSSGFAFSRKLSQIVVGVNRRRENLSDTSYSQLHFFDLENTVQPIRTLKLSSNICSMSLSPDESRIAMVFDQHKESMFEIAVMNMEGHRLARTELKKVIGSPTWTPGGEQIAVVHQQGGLTFLDSMSLETNNRYFGPKLSDIAFHPNNETLALSSDSKFGGIVLPQSELNSWSEKEGAVRYQLLRDQFSAYSLQVELRRACPPRAALFLMDNEIVFESEKLTGYFRYIPKRTVARLSFSDNPELIASTLLCTLDEFEISNAAKEPVLGPNFPGEDKYLIESGVAPDRLGTVRYHGHNNPYDIDHKNVKEMVVVVSHKGRLHFWLCKQTEQGQFHESDWPHCDLSCELPDEELGQGIVAAIDILLASPSK